MNWCSEITITIEHVECMFLWNLHFFAWNNTQYLCEKVPWPSSFQNGYRKKKHHIQFIYMESIIYKIYRIEVCQIIQSEMTSNNILANLNT